MDSYFPTNTNYDRQGMDYFSGEPEGSGKEWLNMVPQLKKGKGLGGKESYFNIIKFQ